MTDMPNPDKIPELDDNVDITYGRGQQAGPGGGAKHAGDPGSLKVTAGQPYHILFVADFAGEKGTLAGPLQNGVVNVTADTFDELFAQASPALNYTSIDPLVPGNVMVEVNLRFNSLQSFQPKHIAEQIPAAKALLAAREQIVSRLRGKISAAQLTQVASASGLNWLSDALKWTPSATPAAPAGAVDDLLGQLDLGGGESASTESTPRPKSALGSLVAAAAGGGASLPAEEAAALRRALAEADRRLNAWLNAVLHAPSVQAVESAWRSLKFLITHMNFRRGLRLSALHASREQLLERFRTLLIDPVFDAGADAPDLILVDAQFGNTAPDLEALDELAQHGASLPAVVLTNVSPAFLGVKHGWQVPTLPPVHTLMDQWQFAKWKTLRTQPYARSLGVVLGRGLLRGPHGPADAKDLEFAYREEAVAEKDFLWAGGATAAGCSAAQSVADSGWPTRMTGYIHGRVEGFTTAMGGKNNEKKFGPTDVTVPMDKVEELALGGLNVATGIKDRADAHDDAIVWNGLTAAIPPKTDQAGYFEVSLPYQLFAGRLSGLLYALKPHLSGKSADQIVAYVLQHVRDWLTVEGGPAPEEQQISVQVRPAEDNPATQLLAVTVTPPQQILPGGVPIVLGYRLT